MALKQQLLIMMAVMGLHALAPADALSSSDTEYYPIIFVHGHGADKRVEKTWLGLIEDKISGNGGYYYYGKIWVNSTDDWKNGSYPARSIFSFNYYRTNYKKIHGDPIGKIGLIPLNYTGSSHDYYQRDGQLRISYAERLASCVDDVLRATGASKVILIAHSMGGLVSRAYIRWGGGHGKVEKILTVGTPNKGMPDDVRLTLPQINEAFSGAEWQVGGEYEEMTQKLNFEGRSYTDWLNDGWQAFCDQHGIRYATIRGDYCPWIPLFDIGDGVVDDNDAKIGGAEFNAVVHAAHMDDFDNPLASSYPKEWSLTSSTFTAEVIKRWTIEDRLHVGGKFIRYSNNRTLVTPGPNPFDTSILYDYELSGLAVYGRVDIYTIAGELVETHSFPLFPGIVQPVFPMSDLAMGAYLMYTKAYDMNGRILDESFKLAKVSGSNHVTPVHSAILSGPSRLTTARMARFDVAAFRDDQQQDSAMFKYNLDGEAWSDYSSEPTIELSGLSLGRHVLYVAANHDGQFAGDAAVYTWIVTDDAAVMEEEDFGEHIFWGDGVVPKVRYTTHDESGNLIEQTVSAQYQGFAEPVHVALDGGSPSGTPVSMPGVGAGPRRIKVYYDLENATPSKVELDASGACLIHSEDTMTVVGLLGSNDGKGSLKVLTSGSEVRFVPQTHLLPGSEVRVHIE